MEQLIHSLRVAGSLKKNIYMCISFSLFFFFFFLDIERIMVNEIRGIIVVIGDIYTDISLARNLHSSIPVGWRTRLPDKQFHVET